jgi:hypothetical protein
MNYAIPQPAVEGLPRHLEILNAAGIFDMNITPFAAMQLAHRIEGILGAQIAEDTFRVQDEKKAEGDAEWFYWHVTAQEILACMTDEERADVRRRIGR